MITPWILMFAAPAEAGELREPLMKLLNAYEHGATHEDLAALGEGVSAELIEIAADGSVPHSRRGRAVSALGHFPDATVRTFLDGQLTSEDHYMQRKAAVALVVGFKDDALPSLETALVADDVQLRLATVRAIGTLDSDAARTALTERKRLEKNDLVKKALDDALAEKAE